MDINLLTQHILKIKSKNFIYYTIGKGEPILMIAGLGSDKTIWNSLIKLLKDYFKIIFFDNKGIGDNSHFTAPIDTKAMARDVLDIIDHLNLKKINIVGHSLGSYVAQHIAAEFQNRIKKLILIATRMKTSINSVQHYEAVEKLLRLGIDRKILVQDSLSWLYGSPFLKDQKKSAAILNATIKNAPICSLENLLNQIQATANHDATRVIKKIKNDTLVIQGSLDIICTPDEGKILANSIKKSRLVLLNNIGHMIPIEATNELSKLIKKFCLD